MSYTAAEPVPALLEARQQVALGEYVIAPALSRAFVSSSVQCTPAAQAAPRLIARLQSGALRTMAELEVAMAADGVQVCCDAVLALCPP